MRIAKWGKSLAVRLPRTMVETLQLKEGDDVQISVTRGSSLAAKAPDAKALIEGLRKYRGRLPEGFRFDRAEAHHRG